MNDKQWSNYSLALYDAWKYTTDNLCVEACPGAGKTTNLEYMCSELIPKTERTIYLSFGNPTVKEAKARLPIHMQENIKTINGLGASILYRELDRPTLDRDKVFKIAIKEIKQGRMETRPDWFERLSLVKQAVGHMKIASDVTTEDDFYTICDTYDIDYYPGMERDCIRVLDKSDEDEATVDFDDQIRFPVIKCLPAPYYDNILVDEYQDTNGIQVELIKKLRGRYCLVGDQHQSIYGFRGAMDNSMAYGAEAFNCVRLPLKLTYRCPKLVVAEARLLFDDIEALETAPDGTVSYGNPLAKHTSQDMILCRLNSPLVSYAYALLKRGIPCHVKGRDIGQGLIKLIDKLACSNVLRLTEFLEEWREIEVGKAMERNNLVKVQSIHDKADSLKVFLKQCNLLDSPHTVKSKIENMFSEGSGVCLSTVHKAKGLEAENVYILQYDLMPLEWAIKPWEREQERNIQYVAVTRSKDKLVYM